MSKKRTLLLVSAAALSATAATAQTSNSTDANSAFNVPPPSRVAPLDDMVGASFDYFNYEAKISGYGSASSGLAENQFQGTLRGSLLGGTASMSFFSPSAFLDIGYRGGSLDGTLNFTDTDGTVLPLQTTIDRQELSIDLSKRVANGFLGFKHMGYRLGVEYDYINQDISLDLPTGWHWNSTGTRNRSYNETYHILYGTAGLQLKYNLVDGDSVKLDIIPRGQMSLGYAYLPDHSSASGTGDGGLTWKGQATLDLEARFGEDFNWRVFVEGGWKYVGIETSDSRDYYGPYARAGLTYSF